MLESLPAEEAPAAAAAAASGVAVPTVAPAAAAASPATGPTQLPDATKPATASRSAPRNGAVHRSAKTASSQAATRERASRSRSTASASADADVSLLAALIGHAEPGAVSGSGRQRDDATIAGLVQRCDAEADRIGVFECRRRICDGYWGKAQACPRRLAPASAN
jgi:hypothetical protein